MTKTRRYSPFVIAGTSGALALALLLSGCSSTASTSSATPSSKTNTSKMSAAEKDFVTGYSNRFQNAKAAFQAQQAWLATHDGEYLTVGPDFFKSYVMGTPPNGSKSSLGFTLLKRDPKLSIGAQSPTDFFNQVRPQLDRLMNMMAMNPLANQRMALADQFQQYDGRDSSGAATLTDALERVVATYGPAAVYKVNRATTDRSADPNTATIFEDGPPVIDAVDDSGKTISFSANASVSISVTTFDADGANGRKTAIIKEVQFSVDRTRGPDPFNGGPVGIGALHVIP